MVFFNAATKELNIKIVYYGPGLSGKTTNLQYIYNTLPEKDKGRMLSLATSDDRTLFFDFLPLELGEVQGMKTRIQLYTVPGQVYYNTTRKLVLRGCDGIAFIADSQEPMAAANKESLENLRQNLFEQGDDLGKTPMVIQYNKRDLKEIISVDELRTIINPEGRPDFEAVATEGQGVFTTLKNLIKITLKKVSQDQGFHLGIKLKSEAAAEGGGETGGKTAPEVVKKEPESIWAEKQQWEEKPEKITLKPVEEPPSPKKAPPVQPSIKEDILFVPTAPYKVPEIQKTEKPPKTVEKIKLGFDKELGEISPAASAYLSEFSEPTVEQKEVEKRAAEFKHKAAPQKTARPEERISSEKELFNAAEELFALKSAGATKIADEIKVEVSNNEVSIDQSGIRVPVKIHIPKSMQNVNLRFDLQIEVQEDED